MKLQTVRWHTTVCPCQVGLEYDSELTDSYRKCYMAYRICDSHKGITDTEQLGRVLHKENHQQSKAYRVMTEQAANEFKSTKPHTITVTGFDDYGFKVNLQNETRGKTEELIKSPQFLFNNERKLLAKHEAFEDEVDYEISCSCGQHDEFTENFKIVPSPK